MMQKISSIRDQFLLEMHFHLFGGGGLALAAKNGSWSKMFTSRKATSLLSCTLCDQMLE